jgi:hypothetical protein
VFHHTTLMEQILARLLAEMNAMRERMKAKIGAEIKTIRKKMDSNQEKSETFNRKVEAKINAYQERMEAKMDAWLEEMSAWRKPTPACREATVCLEKTEAYLERKSQPQSRWRAWRRTLRTLDGATHKEAVGATDDRSGDRHLLAVGRHRQPKERTKCDGGSRQKLAAARRRMNRRAILAPRKGHGRQGPGGDDVVPEPLNDGHLARPKRHNGISDRGLRRQLPLGSMKIFHEALGQIAGLEVAKRAVEFSVGLPEVSYWTLCRGGPLRNERRGVQSTTLGKEQR